MREGGNMQLGKRLKRDDDDEGKGNDNAAETNAVLVKRGEMMCSMGNLESGREIV